MKVEEKVALCAIKNDSESHIVLDQSICKLCKTRLCLRACPAQLYTQSESGEISLDHSDCLECGTCLVICPNGAVSWRYPNAGFGIYYRLG